MKKILLLIIAAFLSISVNAADAFFYAKPFRNHINICLLLS